MLRMNNRIALGSNLGKSIGNGTTSRYMSDLDGVADYYTIPTVTLSGGFIIEADFSIVDNTVNSTFLASGTDSDIFFKYSGSNSRFEFKKDGILLPFNTFIIPHYLSDDTIS